MVGSLANTGMGHVVKVDTNSENLSIVDFWHGLRYRSTSKSLDVAICGSILMGTDLGRVLSAPDDEKMQTFWLCQKQIPASILWCNGPRLRIDGFRWASSNIMHPKTVAVPPSQTVPRAAPTDLGLLVDGIEAVVLEDFPLPMDDEVTVRFSFPGTSPPKYYRFFKGAGNENETWAELKDVWNGRGALLMAQLPASHAALMAALVMPIGVIGDPDSSNKDGDAATISARYLAQVMVFMEGGEEGHDASRVVDGFDGEHKAIRYRQREVLDLADLRCIGSSRHWRIF